MYCSVLGIGLVLQEAWVQRGTIRSNICFAPNTNLTRYKLVYYIQHFKNIYVCI